MPKSKNMHMAIYTDNTAIFASSWSYKKLLNTYRTTWINLRFTSITGSLFNPTKTQAITFTKKRLTRTDHIKVTEHYIVDSYSQISRSHLKQENNLGLGNNKKNEPSLSCPKKPYRFLLKNSKLKISIKLNHYKVCVRPVITYGYQIWVATAKTYVSKIQNNIEQISLHYLYKTHDTPIRGLHSIREHIRNSMESVYNTKYHYSKIRNTGNYDINNM